MLCKKASTKLGALQLRIFQYMNFEPKKLKFRRHKISRFSRFMLEIAKLNTREIFEDHKIAKLNTCEKFRNLKIVKLNTCEM